MKPTIKELEKRKKEAADVVTFANYALLKRPLGEVSLVDFRNTCEINVFSSTELEIFCKGYEGNYYFETIVVIKETAYKYGAKSGRYLAITFTL